MLIPSDIPDHNTAVCHVVRIYHLLQPLVERRGRYVCLCTLFYEFMVYDLRPDLLSVFEVCPAGDRRHAVSFCFPKILAAFAAHASVVTGPRIVQLESDLAARL